ncbi:MAG TPA: DUF4153 domain-containing protein [Bacteroidia bacterium]|nr:DUF4153 domain-containing protein [Bacteroidia bacterium]
MKRNDWLLLVAVSFYSFLFYRQSPGINFVIFNFVLLGCLAASSKQIIKSKQWLLAALGSLASALCVGYYGNLLSVIANIISLSILSTLSISENSSVVVSLISSTCAYFASPVNIILDYMERSKNRMEGHPGYKKRIILIGIPVVITLVFFFLYRASNPLFDKLAENINLDFISVSWILFTAIGLCLLYGFFYQRKLEILSACDSRPGDLENRAYKKLTLFGRELNLTDENFSGIILFVLLNLLVLIVNLGDVNYLLITKKLPDGISYSQFVHQGIDALIASIIIAIAIVLFYFRGGLNFFRKSKAIKVLACIWILQNAFMIYSTSCRNTLYITECGLTFKRIGVYVYLMLALTGLITTLVKIVKAKSNSYLFRINGWIFYGFLVILSFPNWDRIVTSYNVENNKTEYPEYMFSLSSSNITDLLPLYQKSIDSKDSVSYNSYRNEEIRKGFSSALYNFITMNDTLDWRSWNYDGSRVFGEITNSNFINSVTVIDLSDEHYHEPLPAKLKIFSKVTSMNLRNSEIRTLKGLEEFPQLKWLDISYNHISDLSGIEKLKNLEYLNLNALRIADYSKLYKLQKLKELHVGRYYISDSMADEICRNIPNLKIVIL